MYRIRFHGRGGQGMKTASRILGRALFLAGFEIQDAPRYGAERRGAPIFAYVRADRKPINERGIITRPDLVVVADDTLLAMPEAGVLTGADRETTFFIHSGESAGFWQERLNIAGHLLTHPPLKEEQKRLIGASCVGAAARLLGMIAEESLVAAVGQELAALGPETVAANLALARETFAALAAEAGCVREGQAVSAATYKAPSWLDLPLEGTQLSAPAIHGGATSEVVRTGLWRTLRPVIDEELCNRCWWICSTFCPEGAIRVDEERRPRIDYDHCKGCMVCLAQCPTHAIEAQPEKSEGETS